MYLAEWGKGLGSFFLGGGVIFATSSGAYFGNLVRDLSGDVLGDYFVEFWRPFLEAFFKDFSVGFFGMFMSAFLTYY